MVSLYAVALENIRIYSPLSQELYSVLFSGLFLEDSYELSSYDLPLFLRLCHCGKLIEKPVHSVHIYQISVHLTAKDLHYLFRLSLTQEPVVYVDTHQLFSYRFYQKGCNH